jgi:hypothetical protein
MKIQGSPALKKKKKTEMQVWSKSSREKKVQDDASKALTLSPLKLALFDFFVFFSSCSILVLYPL